MSFRSLNFRLAFLFSTVFLVCSLLLFGITYGLLSRTLVRRQERRIDSLLLEFWALYQLSGLDRFARELPADPVAGFVIRVVDADGETAFLYLPASWAEDARALVDALAAAEAGGSARLEAGPDAKALRAGSLGLPDGNVLQVGVSIEEDLRVVRRFRGIYALVVAPLLLLSFAGGFFFSLRTLKPIQDLIRLIRSIIDTGRVDSRLPARGTGDELDVLVQLFNRMLGRIEALIRGLRDSLDGVAHDLRTPMTRLVGKAEMALASGDSDEPRRVLTACAEEARGMLAMLNTLLDISEAETGVMRLHRRETDIADLLRDMVELYQYAAEEKGIQLSGDFPASLVVSVDPNRFRQAVSNLLDNAVKYTPSGGTVRVAAVRERAAAVIEIVDTGVGVPTGELERIWERFFRSDRSRSEPGLGLGLSLVRAIVEAHNGGVDAVSRPGEGSEFRVRLPLPT
jgi:signal transduction histidine kinase